MNWHRLPFQYHWQDIPLVVSFTPDKTIFPKSESFSWTMYWNYYAVLHTTYQKGKQNLPFSLKNNFLSKQIQHKCKIKWAYQELWDIKNIMGWDLSNSFPEEEKQRQLSDKNAPSVGSWQKTFCAVQFFLPHSALLQEIGDQKVNLFLKKPIIYNFFKLENTCFSSPKYPDERRNSSAISE